MDIERNDATGRLSIALSPGESDAAEERSSWYAVQTRPRHEKCVAEQLRLRSLPTFLPVYRCVHRWKNGVQAELELPLFPCYLFTCVSARTRLPVLQLPGVVGLAGPSAHPTTIPEPEINALRAATEQLKAEPHPFLNIGDRVRIVAGPLFGMEGILARRKQALRVVLSIEIIMRSITVEVSAFDIEHIPGLRRSPV